MMPCMQSALQEIYRSTHARLSSDTFPTSKNRQYGHAFVWDLRLHWISGFSAQSSRKICSANFEPQIQVKSKAVDTGRGPSFAHLSVPMKGPTHCGHGVDSPKSFACAMREDFNTGSQSFVDICITSAKRAKTSRDPLCLSNLFFNRTPEPWTLWITPPGTS
jgi:hypothetical protein